MSGEPVKSLDPDLLLEASRVMNAAGAEYAHATRLVSDWALQNLAKAAPSARAAILGDAAALRLRTSGQYDDALKYLQEIDTSQCPDPDGRLHVLRALANGQKYTDLKRKGGASADDLETLRRQIREDLAVAFQRDKTAKHDNRVYWHPPSTAQGEVAEDDLRQAYLDDAELQKLVAAAALDLSTPEKSLEARRHAEAGLRTNPKDADLWATLGNALVSDYLNGGWNGAGVAEVDRAKQAAESAKALDPSVARAHFVLGFVSRIEGEHERARAFFEEAIKLDSNYAGAHAQLANELVILGRANEAIPAVQQAIRLSPDGPNIGVYHWVEGRAYFALGDWKNAISSLEKAVRFQPNLWFSHAWLIAAYALNNQDAEAQATRDLFQSAFPARNLESITKHYASQQRHTAATLKSVSSTLLEGLQKAGLK